MSLLLMLSWADRLKRLDKFVDGLLGSKIYILHRLHGQCHGYLQEFKRPSHLHPFIHSPLLMTVKSVFFFYS